MSSTDALRQSKLERMMGAGVPQIQVVSRNDRRAPSAQIHSISASVDSHHHRSHPRSIPFVAPQSPGPSPSPRRATLTRASRALSPPTSPTPCPAHPHLHRDGRSRLPCLSRAALPPPRRRKAARRPHLRTRTPQRLLHCNLRLSRGAPRSTELGEPPSPRRLRLQAQRRPPACVVSAASPSHSAKEHLQVAQARRHQWPRSRSAGARCRRRIRRRRRPHRAPTTTTRSTCLPPPNIVTS